MEGFLHTFEFNQGKMAKKVHAHKRQNGGLETYRDSMELQVETSRIHYPEGESPYSSQVEDGWSKNNSYSNVGSVRKQNDEELSKQSGPRNNAPSLVARLMGLDMMPLDTKSVILSDERSISENMERKFSKKGMNKRGSFGRGSSNFNNYNQTKFNSFYQDFDDEGRGQNFGEPRQREHPQEEELQKFKKEFEEYQAARLKECLKVVEIGNASRQMLAQENLDKEKVLHDASSQREASHSSETKLPNSDMMESISTKLKESYHSKSRTPCRDFEESLMMKSRSRLDICSSHTQIVTLKPGINRICNCNHEENWISSSDTLQGRNSIEDFLDEVRERLNCERQGKTVKKGFVGPGNGIDTTYHEKASGPKEIAHHVAKEVIRESVTRDAEENLHSSESTRSQKQQKPFPIKWSRLPEFFTRDTRKFLSERLRNVMKSEAHFDIPERTCGNTRSYILDYNKDRLKKEENTTEHELDDNLLLHKELSPRNLVRSLSAPVSRTSFEKLLLEDRHILTGALIRRKLEAVDETMPVDNKKQKKDRFNIKEKVSNFKYTLGMRGKLFGKRVQSMVESHGNEYGPLENSTEVAPSPASLCSYAPEKLERQTEYSSPTSTPVVSSINDVVMRKDFRDISSGFNDGPEDFPMKQEPLESELVQLEDPAESYVRDLLVASGLYFGSSDKSLSRGDTFAKTIGNSVFEEVEESHKILLKENERSIKDQNKLEHKVLLDLLNEALYIVLGPPLTLPRFRRKLSSYSMQPPQYGKELLKIVWDIIRVSLYPSSNTSHSLDSLVAQDLGSISWYGLTNDEINILEREIACLIADDLVEEFINNMLLGVV